MMASACGSPTRPVTRLSGHAVVFYLAVAVGGGANLAVAQLAPLAHTQESSTNALASKNDYTDEKNWLCRPGRHDACTGDLAATVIGADGKLNREPWTSTSATSIDCFYVYPTVSNDSTPNSSMTAGPEELNIARMQFARFGSKCRLYAPLYRQETRA